jgi:hypothetical protein
MSAVASAGVAAWVVPEILTAKPAGATMSGPTAPASPVSSGATTSGVPTDGTSGVTTAAATTQPPGPTSGVTTAAATTQPSGPLAYSGLNIERDAQVGAALIAGGWAMHHWASRTQEGRPTE